MVVSGEYRTTWMLNEGGRVVGTKFFVCTALADTQAGWQRKYCSKGKISIAVTLNMTCALCVWWEIGQTDNWIKQFDGWTARMKAELLRLDFYSPSPPIIFISSSRNVLSPTVNIRDRKESRENKNGLCNKNKNESWYPRGKWRSYSIHTVHTHSVHKHMNG